MAKFVLYNTQLDILLCERGTTPVIYESEADAKRDLPKNKKDWVIRPESMLKKWAAEQEKTEQLKVARGYIFKCPWPAMTYVAPADQLPVLLILADKATAIGQYYEGCLIKDFATQQDAVTYGAKTISNLCKAHPAATYYVYDHKAYKYLAMIDSKGINYDAV